jgi:hypothetical protein
LAGPGGIVFSKYRSDLYRYWNSKSLKNTKLLDSITFLLPGMSSIYSHPIWELLSLQITEERNLVALAQLLDPKLLPYLIYKCPKSSAILIRKYSHAEYLFKKNSQFLRLISRCTLDELAALLILMRAHELCGLYKISHALKKTVIDFFLELAKPGKYRHTLGNIFEQTLEHYIYYTHEVEIEKRGWEYKLFYKPGYAYIYIEESPLEIIKRWQNAKTTKLNSQITRV